MRRRRGLAIGGACLLILSTASGCTSRPNPASQPAPDGASWRRARAELAALRARYAPAQARTQRVKLTMRHEPTGRRLQARGAVAVGEGDGLRMILLGPGGTTALDLWICDDRFAYRLPALDLDRRGMLDEAEPTGLPVGFLRWWFLERLAGRLLSYLGEGTGRRFVLTADGRVLFVEDDDGLTVTRGQERLSLWDGDCGRARYRHDGLGLTIEVHCEGQEEEPPPARAFADPDDPERLCPGARGGGA